MHRENKINYCTFHEEKNCMKLRRADGYCFKHHGGRAGYPICEYINLLSGKRCSVSRNVCEKNNNFCIGHRNGDDGDEITCKNIENGCCTSVGSKASTLAYCPDGYCRRCYLLSLVF